MLRLTPFFLPLALLLPAAPAGAEVLDVRGPSPDFAEIEDAVTAAADGDVIRIWPGTYSAFWIDDKSLTLVSADTSGAVLVNGTSRIRNLAPQRSVAISGVSATSLGGHALVVSDCQGSVRIREGNFVGGWLHHADWVATSAIFVTHCDDVELTYCTALGGWQTNPFGDGFQGDPGLTVESSNVSLFHSTFEGYDGGDGVDEASWGGGGGSGVLAWGGGRVYISGCMLIGGDGGDCGIAHWLHGAQDGGSGGWGYNAGTPEPEAWFLDNVYQPGLGGSGWDGLSDDGPDGQDADTGTHLPGVSRILRASRLIDDTDSMALIFTGNPGDLVSVRFTRTPGYDFAPVRGPLLLHTPAAPQIVPWRILGEIDATGFFQTTIAVKDLPALEHATLHLQGNLSGTENYYSSSSWTVILDSAW